VKRLLFFSTCLFMLGSSASYGAQLLVNPFFENTTPLPPPDDAYPVHRVGWNNNPNIGVIDYMLPTNFAVVPSAAPDGNGNWGAQLEVGFGSKSGQVTQNVDVPAGKYKISASALVRIFDNSDSGDPSFTSSMTLLLHADTGPVINQLQPVGQDYFEHNRVIHGGRWSSWETMNTGEFIVDIQSRIRVRVEFVGNGQEGSGGVPAQPFAQLVADSIQLQAELIPEPASLALGCIGAIACVAMQRRRKQR
jgi:hypothetical protein